ncbi:23S rRNA (adenine(2503)-C(2))-methyltransferase RlmN [Flavobacteriaceae bacterium]|nr:23S rRNA (adenine(2503)-C(2))-methyltransferase RlmN [Flavobacteriaceae bacterium]MDA8704109.1 23S rRNA (adenine(2503)-C(2))-methyltransferase RlmN [Flavobacteriaceae bacterium]MDB3874354.1 23S rRNA (adenine(2503)-C(2))-methyltransferase RlmN [Flavobacteriaceae bacterium]MDC0560186.1 23S rRNA (adenine(2503)-C(2))-methyltransferase RlmN [Flavobacteriaceae bacterium]MDC0984798.1 23S rRNA (adenine(2503)-C(2))-methyltransferase RlmN [Flavobacteriaceae bacterium]|tara:strand:+ start:389 stop:1432 length:1044 start_codon:yes stop_codon:yes gene_type:complete
MKIDIRSLSENQIIEFFEQKGFDSYRGKQVYEWIWKKSTYSFDEMTNLSKDLRLMLDLNFVINHIEVDKIQKSSDGTIKNAVKLFDDYTVESVLIPTDDRTTACVSSQVGCSLDCKFCATSKLKRMRNLNPDEIYDQVVTINNQSLKYFKRSLSNIVFMGMGEPLMNYNNLIESIEKISSDKGLNISQKRIVVSTSGIPKMIKKLADENLKVNLALSLHSAIEETRNSIMPFSAKFSLEDIKESLLYWYSKTKRRITFEYIVWKGINDSVDDINALVNYCKYIPSKVNLIEYNSIGDETFKSASQSMINLYKDLLEKNKITVTVRRSRGKDIDAACGQLANKEVSLN